MAYWLGAIVGALVGSYLLSRLALWLLKAMGDKRDRILGAHGATFAFVTVAGGYGYADGGEPQFLHAAEIYILPIILWLAIDLLALRGRRAKAAEQAQSFD